MSRRVLTKGRVEQGNLLVKPTRHLQQALKGWPTGDVRVTIEKDTRNLRQNGLYWVWNIIVGQTLGYDPEDVHELNKSNCNRRTFSWVDRKTGEIHDVTTGASTADLSVDAFAEYMERVQRFWAEQGISLPTSEEGTWR